MNLGGQAGGFDDLGWNYSEVWELAGCQLVQAGLN